LSRTVARGEGEKMKLATQTRLGTVRLYFLSSVSKVSLQPMKWNGGDLFVSFRNRSSGLTDQSLSTGVVFSSSSLTPRRCLSLTDGSLHAFFCSIRSGRCVANSGARQSGQEGHRAEPDWRRDGWRHVRRPGSATCQRRRPRTNASGVTHPLTRSSRVRTCTIRRAFEIQRVLSTSRSPPDRTTAYWPSQGI
jgi:hypothetical protein